MASQVDADLLRLNAGTRAELWAALEHAIDVHVDGAADLDAAGSTDPEEVRLMLERFDFDRPLAPVAALNLAVHALRRLQPQVGHPRHFGIFDPAPTTMGIVADALAAAFNPCLASWDGSPFGVAAEAHLVSAFAQRFGYPEHAADGMVTSGGSEANLTALLLALTARFPDHHRKGVRGLPGQPVVYSAATAHPSVRRAAALAGLGDDAVREVPIDDDQRMDVEAFEALLVADRADGLLPLMLTVTVGTTGAGVIDPLATAARAAARNGVWLHADAAWGGAAALLPELRTHLEGLDRADSITFDPHKWLSVPMACGLLLTRHRSLLEDTFGVQASFLPHEPDRPPDPFMRSLRWSRGFASLKLLLSLTVAGWQGYEQALRRQTRRGERLRDRLIADSWSIVNKTPLPVVCFVDAGTPRADVLDRVAHIVNQSGQAKVMVAVIAGRRVLRACITNSSTTDDDVDLLVELLHAARAQADAGQSRLSGRS